MNFLKQNAFLVAVGAIFLIGMIVEIVVLAGNDLQEKAIAPRQELDSKIQSLQKAGIVSDGFKDKLKKQAEDLKKETAEVAKQVNDWTDKYSVLVMKNTVPVFPWESDYRKKGYTGEAVTAYENSLQNLRATLDPVKLCSAEEVSNLAQEELDKLDELEKERALRAAEDANRDAAARPSRKTAPPGGGMMTVMGPGGQMGPGAGGQTMNIQAEARRLAEARISIKQASQGSIFVDPNALQKLPLDRNREDLKGLWDAQLSLWVQKDIINAIKETNAEAFGRAKPSAANAWVKRLKDIRVTAGYSLAQAGGTSSGGSAAPAPAFTPMQGGRMMTMNRMGPGMMGNFPVRTANPAAPIDPNAASFTNHGSNKEYDVVRYSFTVVMPPRRLLQLEKNLLKQNLHTVLNVTMSPPIDAYPEAQEPGGRQPGMNAGSQQGGLVPYYYGPDAVAEIRIEGELLLMTPRTRGQYNQQTKKWDTKALVPVEVLEALPPEALRSEDQTRIADSEKPAGTPRPFVR